MDSAEQSGPGHPYRGRGVEAGLRGPAVERRAHRPGRWTGARQSTTAASSAACSGGRSSRPWSNSGSRRPIDVENGSLFDIVERAPEGKLKARLRKLPKLQLLRDLPVLLVSSGRRSSDRGPRRARSVRQRLQQGSDHPPLRHLECVLPALPRRAHGLQLRLLHRFRQRHRPGADRQARPHLPQASAEARRDAARHRLRLGRDADPRGQALRRRRPRRLAVGRADRARPRAHPRGRAGGPHHHRGRDPIPNSTGTFDKISSIGMFEQSASPTMRPIS